MRPVKAHQAQPPMPQFDQKARLNMLLTMILEGIESNLFLTTSTNIIKNHSGE